MLTGLLYFILGIFSGGSTTAFYIFSKSSSNYQYFYLILLVFTGLGFIGYTVVACLYVNHQRPNRESEENEETRHVYNITFPKTYYAVHSNNFVRPYIPIGTGTHCEFVCT